MVTMEEFASGFLNVIEEDAASGMEDHEDEVQRDAADTAEPDSSKKRRSLRNGIFRAANIQDKLLEK